MVAACSTNDCQCAGVDSDQTLNGTTSRFGDCLLQIDSLAGWCHAVAWSPSGLYSNSRNNTTPHCMSTCYYSIAHECHSVVVPTAPPWKPSGMVGCATSKSMTWRFYEACRAYTHLTSQQSQLLITCRQPAGLCQPCIVSAVLGRFRCCCPDVQQTSEPGDGCCH